MTSGDLIPSDRDNPEPASNEIQFALVISRMIDTVKNSPEHLRQAVYDLARYKLQEQFTYADAKNIRRTQEALEAAIRGVEEFSKEQIGIEPLPPAPQLADSSTTPRNLPAPDLGSSVPPRPRLEIPPESADIAKLTNPLWPLIKRTATLLAVIGGVLLVVQQRERLAAVVRNLPNHENPVTVPEQQPPTQAAAAPAPAAPVAKPNPLRPTDYGVYAAGDDSLTELPLLPGRPPDIRVAVSAALKVPSHTMLPGGHPKFIVFRRDAGTNVADRAEVRIVAKIAREFSAEAAGKKLDAGDDTWVIRNVAFPFRSSPIPDSPDMYELHSEDPALELTPGRYALILKTQAYDFSVEGETVDPKQCIERVISTSGTFYTDCKKP